MKHSRAATRKRSGRAGGLGRRLSPQFAAIAITSVLRDTISPAADSTGGRPLAIAQWWPRHRRCWTLIWSLIDPVSCVSCVSWMRWLYAAETHETFHRESGMRYHHSTTISGSAQHRRYPMLCGSPGRISVEWEPLSARSCLARPTLLVGQSKVPGIVISVTFASRRVERFGAGPSSVRLHAGDCRATDDSTPAGGECEPTECGVRSRGCRGGSAQAERVSARRSRRLDCPDWVGRPLAVRVTKGA